MRFTIDLDKIKKVTLIILILLLATYLMVRSVILVIDYNERKQIKIEKIEKSYV